MWASLRSVPWGVGWRQGKSPTARAVGRWSLPACAGAAVRTLVVGSQRPRARRLPPARPSRFRSFCSSDTVAFVQTFLTSAEQLTEELLGFVAYLTKGAQSEVLQVAAALDLSLSQLRVLHTLDVADR